MKWTVGALECPLRSGPELAKVSGPVAGEGEPGDGGWLCWGVDQTEARQEADEDSGPRVCSVGTPVSALTGETLILGNLLLTIKTGPKTNFSMKGSWVNQ